MKECHIIFPEQVWKNWPFHKKKWPEGNKPLTQTSNQSWPLEVCIALLQRWSSWRRLELVQFRRISAEFFIGHSENSADSTLIIQASLLGIFLLIGQLLISPLIGTVGPVGHEHYLVGCVPCKWELLNCWPDLFLDLAVPLDVVKTCVWQASRWQWTSEPFNL